MNNHEQFYMNILKKTFLFLLGFGLLILGNRNFLAQLLDNSDKKDEESNRQENTSFDVMQLQYHPDKDSLSVKEPYFQITRYDPSQSYSNTKIETNNAETATASS